MNKVEVIEWISKETGIEQNKVRQMVNSFVRHITDVLAEEEEVRLTIPIDPQQKEWEGAGTFLVTSHGIPRSIILVLENKD